MTKYLGVALVFLVLGGSGFLFFSKNQQSSRFISDESNLEINDNKDQGVDRADDVQMVGVERYVEYSSAASLDTAHPRRVLFFYANWCPTCRPVDKDFQDNADKIPEDVVVIRVNYNDSDTDNEEKELASKYGIGYQHTFVQIDAQGNKVNLWNGGGLEELLENLE